MSKALKEILSNSIMNHKKIMKMKPMSDAEYLQKYMLLNRSGMNTRYTANGCFMKRLDGKLVETDEEWDAINEDEKHSYQFSFMPRRMFDIREFSMNGQCCYCHSEK